MSLLPNQSFVTPDKALFARGAGGGGGGGGGSFSTINVSTIDIQANGDINWDGSVNFQGTNGGYLSLLSSFAGDNAANGIEITGATGQGASTIQMYVNGQGDANLVVTNPASKLNIPGANIGQVSSITAQAATFSSINGAVYPPTTQPGVTTISPIAPVTYIKGGGTATLYTLPSQVAQHSYRIEFPVKIQGWNATDGNTNSYAPSAADWLSIYPQGNVVGSPAPVFTTLQMAQVSSINNDWEGTITGVWKTTASGAELIVAATAGSVGYSTSVEIGAFGYVTDLGAI